MIPRLLVTELLPERSDAGRAGTRPYGGLPGKWRSTATGTAAEAIARVEQHFAIHALEIDRTDGISMAFLQWRV